MKIEEFWAKKDQSGSQKLGFVSFMKHEIFPIFCMKLKQRKIFQST